MEVDSLRLDAAHYAQQVQYQLALAAHQARQEMRDPGQTLDGRHALRVLVDRLRQRHLVVVVCEKLEYLCQVLA